MSDIEIVSDLKREEAEGGVLITGFRGFGLVGYLVSKHLALALKARKRGYILTPYMPPVILIEEDGVGYPFEIYFHDKRRIVIIVHRANPEREVQDDYVRTLADWASELGISLAVLVGGLSDEFKPPEERYGYRWISNRHYVGKRLEAPVMEVGLGVIGPLALLHIYLENRGIPSIMVLPYAAADRSDYDAVAVGLKVISREILGIEISTREVEKMAAQQREFIEYVRRSLEEQAGERDEEESGIYM